MADPTTVPTGIQPNLPAALSELGAALLLPALLVAVIAYSAASTGRSSSPSISCGTMCVPMAAAMPG